MHDEAYRAGKTWADKMKADSAFRDNLHQYVEDHSTNSVLMCLRHHRAEAYYEAVHVCGGRAFLRGKAECV
jgi:hypothetical protein